MEPPTIEDARLTADLIETDFASFLYWKDTDYPEAGVRDGFGSALIRARNGEVLLGRQQLGNVNAGLLYMPGGFIDPRDVRCDGGVDIDRSVAREFKEETGLSVAAFNRRGGYLVTEAGAQVSIAVELVSDLEAKELRAVLVSQIARQNEPELSDFVVYDRPPGAHEADVAAFSRVALEGVFSGV